MTSYPDNEPEAEWEIWYQDLFDRESPRHVEVSGRRLFEGLIELWRRHLFETVKTDGGKGFSRFNLWWKQAGKSVEVVGEWQGQVKLRGWIFGNVKRASGGFLDEGARSLLNQVAEAHMRSILKGKTSEEILAIAKESRNRVVFENQLSREN